jgi:hypothetical protein
MLFGSKLHSVHAFLDLAILQISSTIHPKWVRLHKDGRTEAVYTGRRSHIANKGENIILPFTRHG